MSWFGLGTTGKDPADRPRGYGVTKRPGRLVLGNPKDFFIAHSYNLSLERKYFDVIIHGNKDNTGIQLPDGSWITYDGAQLAELIRSTKAWNGKKPIRLLACNAGECERSYAQVVSDELDVDVAAPLHKVMLLPDGNFSIGAKPAPPATAPDFRVFRPRTKAQIEYDSPSHVSKAWPFKDPRPTS